MSVNYGYSVERVGNEVVYSIFKNGETLTRRNVHWHQLGWFNAIFLCSEGSEKA